MSLFKVPIVFIMLVLGILSVLTLSACGLPDLPLLTLNQETLNWFAISSNVHAPRAFEESVKAIRMYNVQRFYNDVNAILDGVHNLSVMAFTREIIGIARQHNVHKFVELALAYILNIVDRTCEVIEEANTDLANGHIKINAHLENICLNNKMIPDVAKNEQQQTNQTVACKQFAQKHGSEIQILSDAARARSAIRMVRKLIFTSDEYNTSHLMKIITTNKFCPTELKNHMYDKFVNAMQDYINVFDAVSQDSRFEKIIRMKPAEFKSWVLEKVIPSIMQSR